MKVARTIAEIKRDWGTGVGLVPTMGAFHEGHLALMRECKKNHDLAVTSIFVNPTQFGQGEDFEKYPRDFDRDAHLAEQAGVDVIFAPSVEMMYPRRTTEIVVSGVTERWEGASRPGHFCGVATVVAKLFGIVQPDAAYFGLKDLQQCLVVQRMVSDLNIPVDVRLQETVRAPDGLALSSRNVYLSPEQRAVAPHLYREINGIRNRLLEGERGVETMLEQARERLKSDGFEVNYLDLVDLESMAPMNTLIGDAAVIVAARLGNTRLIDNVRIILN